MFKKHKRSPDLPGSRGKGAIGWAPLIFRRSTVLHQAKLTFSHPGSAVKYTIDHVVSVPYQEPHQTVPSILEERLSFLYRAIAYMSFSKCPSHVSALDWALGETRKARCLLCPSSHSSETDLSLDNQFRYVDGNKGFGKYPGSHQLIQPTWCRAGTELSRETQH